MVFLLWAGGALGLPPFTSAPKSLPAAGHGQAELFALDVGCHAGFDRLVVRSRFATPAVSVRYVREIDQPSGLRNR